MSCVKRLPSAKAGLRGVIAIGSGGTRQVLESATELSDSLSNSHNHAGRMLLRARASNTNNRFGSGVSISREKSIEAMRWYAPARPFGVQRFVGILQLAASISQQRDQRLQSTVA
jgi:hypothetical protein